MHLETELNINEKIRVRMKATDGNLISSWTSPPQPKTKSVGRKIWFSIITFLYRKSPNRTQLDQPIMRAKRCHCAKQPLVYPTVTDTTDFRTWSRRRNDIASDCQRKTSSVRRMRKIKRRRVPDVGFEPTRSCSEPDFSQTSWTLD